MNMQENIRYLTVQEVITINKAMIDKYSPGEIVGVKELALLDSAINRPKQSAFGRDAYSNIFDKAAALFESIASNHCFHNANKRTALACLIVFLRYNGYKLMMTEREAESFVVNLVTHQYKFSDISAIIQENSKS